MIRSSVPGAWVAIAAMLALGRPGTPPQSGAGLRVRPMDGNTGTMLVDRCAFLDNGAAFAAGLAMSRGGAIRVRNSLFLVNHSRNGYVAEIAIGSGVGVYFTNNTVLDNLASAMPPGNGGVYVESGNPFYVANNLLWGNAGLDVELYSNGGGPTFFVHNDAESRGGVAPTFNTGNLAVAPQFTAPPFDLTPSPGSALIDAGIRPVPTTPAPFEANWDPGAVDFAGGMRLRVPEIDIGAFEGTSAGALLTRARRLARC